MNRFATLLPLFASAAFITSVGFAAPQTTTTQLTPAQMQALLKAQQSGSLTLPPGVSIGSSSVTFSSGSAPVAVGAPLGVASGVGPSIDAMRMQGAGQGAQEEEAAEPGIKLLVNGEVLDLPAMPKEILDRIIEDMRGQGLEVELLAEDDERAKAPEAKEAIDPMYMQLLQQAVLDRRPSTILRVWSEPELLAPDEDPELKDPEDLEPFEDAPTAPTAPVEPTLPEGLTEPTPPEEIEIGINGIADVVALAKAREEAAATYEADKAAYDGAMAAHQAAMEAFETEKAAHDLANARFQVDKALWDNKKAAYDKEVAKINAEKAKRKAKRTQREIALFTRNVTLGRWEPVGEALMKLGEAQAKAQYTQLLSKISRSPQQVSGQMAQFQEQPAFEFDDIVQIISIAPGGFEDKQATQVAPLVRRVFAQGHSLDDWLVRLREEVARPEEERVISKRLAALILTAQRYNKELAEFLPTFEEMVDGDDREGLNLLARHHMAMHRETPTPEVLGKAWEATLAVLNPGKVDKKQKTEALKRAVDLAGRVRDAKGDAWLRETFTERPERGMEVLAVIGGEASTGMVKSANRKEQRLEDLKLLRGAVDSLLEIAPERAEEWQETLTLVADTWLREAVHSFQNAKQETLGPSSQRDAYGNIYWYEDFNYDYRYQPVKPIEPSELLEVRPDGAWRETLPDSLKPKIDQTIAQLYLKVSEEEQAFPYIEALAGPEPEKANDLAQTFIEVWLKNNDPNSSRNRSSIYNYSFGFNRRASGIPLTRSRQDRNLRALSKWVQKLRGVEGIELDSDLLVRAFTQCHSEAEVYRVDIMEEVFGDLDLLKPETLAAMTQRMRANLATRWRDPATQRNAKTGRKQKEIQAEVQRGYEVASQMLERALETYPGDWRLQQSKGALLHDLNNYRAELKVDKRFAERRIEALGVLRGAAQAYVDGIDELQVNEYSVDSFMTWFYASLGASDVGAITESTLLRKSEIPAIKGMLDGIEGEAGEKHRAMFANLIFTRLSAVNPAVKNRYLEAGFDVAGDHPQAKAARRVYEYYQDLVTEIELVANLDGPSSVGTEPFGVRIDLRYTQEIGRESGGFAKYLQNQANAVNSYYNGGRPQENYRDKFEEAARTLLEEQFEVMSVTFNREDAASRADGDGWQAMSYAYILMRAKGPEVDQVPPLKVDLDFNDVTGYVVLPITSPVVPIDADAQPEVRPYEDLSLTQILDERKSDEGKLVLEVKAQAEGLIPDLDDIVEIAPRDFQVSDVVDQGLSVARFSDDEDSVVAERLWVVELEPKEGVIAPEEFTFAAALDEGVEPVFQRYADADLVTAEATVTLGETYKGERTFPWGWLIGALALGSIFLIGLVVLLTRSKGPKQALQGPRLPEEITPVTVLGLLGDVRRSGSLQDTDRADLDRTALEIEAHYFGQRNGSESPDLVAIAKRWVSRVPQTS